MFQSLIIISTYTYEVTNEEEYVLCFTLTLIHLSQA